jgi:glyoxylase-like metal-dependent hydrolase (beta-lactamase superfamily II)
MATSKKTDRRTVLKAGLGGMTGMATAPLLGLVAFPRAGWAQPSATAPAGIDPAPVATVALSDRITLIAGVPGNVLALSTDDGVVLVDSGAAAMANAVQQRLGGARVLTLLNTHYHADQTGGNALFGEAGAAIHAHEITRQWLSSDYYVPAEDRWVEAPPSAARPTRTFRTKESMTAGRERIECGYLLEAHTRGDIYVYFRDSNVLAVGDVASPLRDPAHDWYAGGWLGGRVDALDDLLEIANADTRVVPAYGAVMTHAELKIERDMMWHLYERTSKLVNAGRSAEDLLEAGVLDEVDRKFEDPYRFLYDAAKGLWAHYTNFGGNVV